MRPGLNGLLEDFEAERERGRPVVLATLVAAQGSTYRKPGARMLIDAHGQCSGLLGGGCFENDLSERAREVLASGRARVITYDLRGADDDLWGLGLGCNGAVRVLLQRLDPGNGYQPLAALAEAARRRQACVIGSVVEQDADADRLGASIVVSAGEEVFSGRYDDLPPEARRRAASALRDGRSQLVTHEGGITVYYDFVAPPPHILILGAGVDAEPVVRLALSLGWRVSLVDHRPARAAHFPDAHAFVPATPDVLAAAIGSDDYSAAVVMSHRLDQDRLYLTALARSPIPYIGLLGPAARRRSLLDSLGEEARVLEARTRSPTGLDIGAESPEEIALSIVAGIQAFLTGRKGGFLSQMPGATRARARLG